MRIKKMMLLAILLTVPFYCFAARIDTVSVPSACMQRKITVVTITPDGAKEAPVIYLLHGYDGSAYQWMKTKPNLPEIADKEGVIFVCPDGENSWYFDSPLKKDSQFETFVAKELVAYVDKHLPTIPKRTARAITGLSMGGHGAMFLSMRHKEVFGAVGSMSGGVDISSFPKNWKISLIIGNYAKEENRWHELSAIYQIKHIENGDLAIIMDCGMSDFFFTVNKNFHQALVKKGIEHDYIVRPGGHTHAYWNNSIDYHILFFMKYFRKK